MESKLCSLQAAAQLVSDGAMMTFSGSLLHRSPSAFIRELARQGRRDLEVVKPSAGYDVDLLAAAGVLRAVQAGYVSFDQPFGLANNYRKAVEAGRVRVTEHA